MTLSKTIGYEQGSEEKELIVEELGREEWLDKMMGLLKTFGFGSGELQLDDRREFQEARGAVVFSIWRELAIKSGNFDGNIDEDVLRQGLGQYFEAIVAGKEEEFSIRECVDGLVEQIGPATEDLKKTILDPVKNKSADMRRKIREAARVGDLSTMSPRRNLLAEVEVGAPMVVNLNDLVPEMTVGFGDMVKRPDGTIVDRTGDGDVTFEDTILSTTMDYERRLTGNEGQSLKATVVDGFKILPEISVWAEVVREEVEYDGRGKQTMSFPFAGTRILMPTSEQEYTLLSKAFSDGVKIGFSGFDAHFSLADGTSTEVLDASYQAGVEGGTALKKILDEARDVVLEQETGTLLFLGDGEFTFESLHLSHLPLKHLSFSGPLFLMNSGVVSLAQKSLVAPDVQVVNCPNLRFPDQTEVGRLRLVMPSAEFLEDRLHDGISFGDGGLELMMARDFFTVSFVEKLISLNVPKLSLYHCDIGLANPESFAAMELLAASDVEIGVVAGDGAEKILTRMDRQGVLSPRGREQKLSAVESNSEGVENQFDYPLLPDEEEAVGVSIGGRVARMFRPVGSALGAILRWIQSFRRKGR